MIFWEFLFSVVPVYFMVVFVGWVKLWNSYQDTQNVTMCRRHRTLSFPCRVNLRWSKYLTTATNLCGIFCQYLILLLPTVFRLLTDLFAVTGHWTIDSKCRSISMAVRFLCSLFQVEKRGSVEGETVTKSWAEDNKTFHLCRGKQKTAGVMYSIH